MKLKWYGTAAILLENDGNQLLFDPFISLNNNAFKPSLAELAAIKNILVTHGHLDHIAHIPAIVEHEGNNATVYCTATPRETLISKGVANERIQKITPGDLLNIGTFEIHVLKGRHVVFNKGLALKTFFNLRMIAYCNNLAYLGRENKVCVEAGETVCYEIRTTDKRVLLLGSLNLDDNTEYPQGADLLILPFQGRSDLGRYAMQFIDRLRPKKVLLDHFDDAFPPISSAVDTRPFVKLMKEKYPDVTVIIPKAGNEWICA